MGNRQHIGLARLPPLRYRRSKESAMNHACDPQQLPRTMFPATELIHITHLPLKVDGQTEHAFIAVINNEAVGSAMAKMSEWNTCLVRLMFVAPKHRCKGAGAKILHRIENYARSEKAEAIEIAVHKGNATGRAWWIRRKFIDDLGRDMREQPEYICMVKPL